MFFGIFVLNRVSFLGKFLKQGIVFGLNDLNRVSKIGQFVLPHLPTQEYIGYPPPPSRDLDGSDLTQIIRRTEVFTSLNRYIQMSSPRLNDTIIIGCITMYLSVFLFGLDGNLVSPGQYSTNCQVNTSSVFLCQGRVKSCIRAKCSIQLELIPVSVA